MAIGAGVAVFGWAAEGLLRELPAERFALSLLLAMLAGVLAWPLRRGLRWPWASALALVWLVALSAFVGLPMVLAAALLAVAALALGLLAVPEPFPGRIGLATTLGLVGIGGACGWLLTLPIHQRWVWMGVLVASIGLRRAALRGALVDALHAWKTAVAASPRWAAGTVMLAGLASTACWMPTMQNDDMAYHLNLPTQLMIDALYAPDPARQVWAYAPWLGDTLHGLLFVLSGQRTHGGMNAVWLLLGGINAWALASALGARASERWASIALMASFPPLVWMAAGMQTELAASVVLLSLMAVTFARQPMRWRLPIAAVLVGGLFALKLLHGLVALPLTAVLVWRHRHTLSIRTVLVSMALLACVAGSSYLQAWLATGNPVLPLANAVFKSPYFALENYRDGRWFTGLSLLTPWHMLFDTSRYAEVDDGALGFALLPLAGLMACVLLRPTPARRAGWIVVTMLATTLIPMQYARYAYPCMALLLLFPLIGSERLLTRRTFIFTAVLACTCNLAWQAHASWLHDTAAFKRTLRSGGDPAQVLPHYTPERVLVRAVPREPAQRVLFTDPHHNAAADMGRQGLALSAHAPWLAARARQAEHDPSGQAWATLLDQEQVRWVLVTTSRPPAGLHAGLQRLGGHTHSELNDVALWRLNTTGATHR